MLSRKIDVGCASCAYLRREQNQIPCIHCTGYFSQWMHAQPPIPRRGEPAAEHLLILHHESGDEINLRILDFKHWEEIKDYLDTLCAPSFGPGQNDIENMLKLIYDNTLETKMYQTYAVDTFLSGKWNIKKVIHLPELGQ